MIIEECIDHLLFSDHGHTIEDISHDHCRYLTRDEILKVLRAEVPVNREDEGRYGDADETRGTRPDRNRPRRRNR